MKNKDKIACEIYNVLAETWQAYNIKHSLPHEVQSIMQIIEPDGSSYDELKKVLGDSIAWDLEEYHDRIHYGQMKGAKEE